MARPQRIRDDLTFGGRIPWAIGLLLVLTIACSLVVAFGTRHGPPLFELGALIPQSVLHGQVWRLATWPFLEASPLGLIFGCLGIYWFGTDLAKEWGSPRFLAVFGAVMLVAASATCLVALVDPAVGEQVYLGSWTATSAMVVAWGLWFPDRIVRIYFILPIRGYWIAWLTVAVTVIFAIYSGWEHFLPQLFAYAGILAWLYRRSLTARVQVARRAFDERRREDERRDRAKKRAKSAAYLRVIENAEDEDDDPPPLPPDVEDKVRDIFGRGGGGKGDLH